MNKTAILIGLVVLFLIIMGVVYTSNVLPSATPVTTDPQYQTVKEVFVDIDGDGHVDFLATGQVILNRGGKISMPETTSGEPRE